MVKFLEQRNLEVWVANKVWKIYGASNQALETGISISNGSVEIFQRFSSSISPIQIGKGPHQQALY